MKVVTRFNEVKMCGFEDFFRLVLVFSIYPRRTRQLPRSQPPNDIKVRVVAFGPLI